MSAFIVRIDHLTESQLEFFGWLKVDQDSEFSIYWNPRYNEAQVVSNDPPRYLLIDDWNDAQFMRGNWDIISGPTKGG
ncbi:MAG TPA: hypothetical protein VIE65_19430 [Methylobacter sp.]|jgi:hypothetical protein